MNKKVAFFAFLFFLLTFVISSAQKSNFDQGVEAYQENKKDRALELFALEIAANPNNCMAYFNRAIIYNQENNYDSAILEVNKSIKCIPHKTKEWIDLIALSFKLRGDIYKGYQKNEEALDDYATAIQLSPHHLNFYMDRAQLYFELQEYIKEENDYHEVLRKDQDNIRALAGLGRNYYAQKKFKEAEKILTRLIKTDPSYIEGFYFRSLVWNELKKSDEAILDIFQALRIEGNSEKIHRLLIYLSGKNPALTLSELNTLITASPEKPILYILKANIQKENKNYYNAIETCNKGLIYSNDSFKVAFLGLRATCYQTLKQFDKSISDYYQILSIYPNDASQYGNLAVIKELKADYEGAIEDLSKAIEIEPKVAYFYYFRAWLKEVNLTDYEAALKDYNTAILLEPNNTFYLLLRGVLYNRRLNESGKAEEDFERILTMDTFIKNGGVRHYALFYLGRNTEAVLWATAIINKYPNAENYYDRCCIYSKMNEREKALKDLNSAFEKGFSNFNHISKDTDLDNIKEMPEFKILLKKWKDQLGTVDK